MSYGRAIKLFPEDSLSIHDIYFKYWRSSDSEKVYRLDRLTSKTMIDIYNKVKNNLKPLLLTLSRSNSINLSQANEFSELYSYYDYFRGEGLFSYYLSSDKDFEPVLRVIKMISIEATKDKSFFYSLFQLRDKVSTYAGVTEAIPDFLIDAIKNNPMGFLDLFADQDSFNRIQYSKYIYNIDGQDEQLVKILKDISTKNTKPYQALSKKLLLQLDK
ncbi:MAG: hypothetical protein ABR974_13930 [Bacteroidales bacterium]